MGETIIQAKQGKKCDITHADFDGSWPGAPWLGSHEHGVVLPNLDYNFGCAASDGLVPRVMLRLDWGGHDSEACDKSATPQAGKDAQTAID